MEKNNLIRILVLLCCVAGGERLYGQAGIRTPRDYLYCAAQSGSDMADSIYEMPRYLQKITRVDLPILDESGFYKDILTGYGGAVFMDLRDSTVVIGHFATGAPSLANMMDIVADVQIAGVDLPVQPLSKVIGVIRDTQDAQEIMAFGLQYTSACKLYQRVRERWPGLVVENTGHSLGGNLTQLISYKYGIVGVTFDPAGIGQNTHLDTTQKENAKNITNYKIHNSLVSTSVTTGLLIGKTVTIYPSDGKTIVGTQAHGLMEIYDMAMNKETGYFKTLNEITALIWKNEGYVTEIGMNGYKPGLIRVNVREKFATYEDFMAYMQERYGAKIEMKEYQIPVKRQPENRMQKIFRLLRETDLLQMGESIITND